MANSAFYSKSTGGFYTREIHGDNIPDDAVEITNERHAELMTGQSSGLQIVAGYDGFPVCVAPPPPTNEEQASSVRVERDRLLSACDWVVAKAVEAGEAVPDEWREYRQALRDVTAQPTFPQSVEWPVALA